MSFKKVLIGHAGDTRIPLVPVEADHGKWDSIYPGADTFSSFPIPNSLMADKSDVSAIFTATWGT